MSSKFPQQFSPPPQAPFVEPPKKPRMRGVMIDIETLGKEPGCVVLTIGAVAFDFDQDTLGDSFYVAISPESASHHGLTIDTSTIMWWLKQSDEARAALSASDAKPLEEAMMALREFIIGVRQTANTRDFEIWANDPDFDLAILKAAFKAVDINPPWAFWESRSVRTNLANGKRISGKDARKLYPRTGTYHNALDDAKYQALYTKLAFDLTRGLENVA